MKEMDGQMNSTDLTGPTLELVPANLPKEVRDAAEEVGAIALRTSSMQNMKKLGADFKDKDLVDLANGWVLVTGEAVMDAIKDMKGRMEGAETTEEAIPLAREIGRLAKVVTSCSSNLKKKSETDDGAAPKGRRAAWAPFGSVIFAKNVQLKQP